MDIKKNILGRLIKINEEMIYVVSHHYIAYFGTIVVLFISIAIVFSLYKLISIFSLPIASWVGGILGIIVYINFMLNFFDVYLDAIIITDRSLIIYEWYGLLKNSIDVIANHAVESAYSEQNGIVDSMFDKGNLIIKTAGGDTVFKNIASPVEVANDINKIIFSIVEKDEEKEGEQIGEYEEKKGGDLDVFMQAMEEVVREYKDRQRDQ